MTSTPTSPSTSWVPVPDGSPFPVAHLPYGVFSVADEAPRVGVAIGAHVLDLAAAAAAQGLDGGHVFAEPTLNAFLALGRPAWTAVRSWVTEVLTHRAHEDLMSSFLVPLDQVRMHLPFEVADYVDFYSSVDHATNVGHIFRPDSAPLPPNWKHLPIGYHGRSGTVVVSGTPVRRPCGQRKTTRDAPPSYGPCLRLDIEAEVGFVVGTPSERGRAVPASDFREHVFGLVLLNDWSARDIQAWEYVPLGPFLGKSFATSISAWVTPLDALAAARVTPPVQDPAPLPYLHDEAGWGLDLALQVDWNGTTISRPPFARMYWTPAQQLAHLTVNGASLRTGDLYASGTVSGPDKDQRGSLLELTWNGAEPVRLADGSERRFLEDGDTVTISAWAPGADGARIGLGEVTGTILPATPTQ
ncbi:MAG TPA: fumarylacetoacetase [Actinomycetes bacterium]|nr:fumarylacetoacetase [Actinomycetes bacterium]